jgi:hypothetical protein
VTVITPSYANNERKEAAETAPSRVRRRRSAASPDRVRPACRTFARRSGDLFVLKSLGTVLQIDGVAVLDPQQLPLVHICQISRTILDQLRDIIFHARGDTTQKTTGNSQAKSHGLFLVAK